MLKGNMNVVLESSCDRCLKPVKVETPLSFEYSVVKPDGFHEEDEDDYQDFMEGYDKRSLMNLCNKKLTNTIKTAAPAENIALVINDLQNLFLDARKLDLYIINMITK